MKSTPHMPLCICCRDDEPLSEYAKSCNGCGRPTRYAHRVSMNLSRYGSIIGPRHNTYQVFCSLECQSIADERRATRRLIEHRRKSAKLGYACAVCGQQFIPCRADALTCSPACRQRAYRERVTARQGLRRNPRSSVTLGVGS
jgi:hypothetical protein